MGIARRVLGSPYAWLLVSTIIWGSLHPLGKFALREVTPIQLILARVVFASIVMFTILVLQGHTSDLTLELRTRPGTMALLGLLSFVLSSGGSMTSLSLLPASVNSLLANVSPLFVAMGIVAMERGRTHRALIIGIVIGFVGLGLVIFGESPSGFGGLALNPLGVILALFGSLAWAGYIGASRQVMTKGNPIAVVVASSIFGGVPWLVLAIANGDFARLFTLPLLDWVILIYLGAIGTGVTYTLWTAALVRLTAASVAVFQYAIPFWAVVLSVLLLGDHVTIPLVLGGLGIILGVAITQRAPRRSSIPHGKDAANLHA